MLVASHWALSGDRSAFKFTSVAPGIKAGLGVRFPVRGALKLHVGMLYLASASGHIASREMRGLSGEDRYDGLSQFAPFVRLAVTP